MTDREEQYYQKLATVLKRLNAANRLAGGIVLTIYNRLNDRRILAIMDNIADALVSIDQANQQAQQLLPKIKGYLPPPKQLEEDKKWVEQPTEVPHLTLLVQEDD